METSTYLAAIERDGTAFLESCVAAPTERRVTACPDWTMTDLLWHLAEVHHFFTAVVESGAQDHGDVVVAERPADHELPSYYRAGLEHLLVVLRAADPAAAVWTWTADHTVGWVIRRMAHETAVHRWDADDLAGRSTVIDAALASDGIDEFLTWFVGGRRGGEELTGSVHIHCTDVAGEWTTRPTPDGLVTTREHAKGDAALRGPAADLLLALWRRTSLATVDVVGDAVVAQQFVDVTRLG